MTQAEDGWGKARNGGLGIVFCCKAHQALEKAWREGKDFGVEAGSAALTVSTWTRSAPGGGGQLLFRVPTEGKSQWNRKLGHLDSSSSSSIY